MRYICVFLFLFFQAQGFGEDSSRIDKEQAIQIALTKIKKEVPAQSSSAKNKMFYETLYDVTDVLEKELRKQLQHKKTVNDKELIAALNKATLETEKKFRDKINEGFFTRRNISRFITSSYVAGWTAFHAPQGFDLDAILNSSSSFDIGAGLVLSHLLYMEGLPVHHKPEINDLRTAVLSIVSLTLGLVAFYESINPAIHTNLIVYGLILPVILRDKNMGNFIVESGKELKKLCQSVFRK